MIIEVYTRMSSALEDKEPFDFTHYLLISKTYTELTPNVEDEDDRPQKKSKKPPASTGAAEVFYFHPEDEILHKHATAFGNFDYTTESDEGASDSKRAFQELGVKPSGHLILLEAAKLGAAAKAISLYLGSEP